MTDLTEKELEMIRSKTPPDHKFAEVWTYKNADGTRYGVVARYERVGGDGPPKTFRPFLDENGALLCTGFSVPCPLYRLDDLLARPDAPVLVVEGEKTAEAATELFPDHVVVTSQGGSVAAGKTDWSPLKGRRVIVWPDNDDPGYRYAEKVMTYVPQATIAAVPPDFPNAWDLADPAPDGADLRAMLVPSGNVVALPTKKTKSKKGIKEMLRASLALVPSNGDSSVVGTAEQALAALKELTKKSADVLIELAEAADLFHTARWDCYADIVLHGHRETMLVDSSSFKRWLVREFYNAARAAPNSEAVRSAIELIKARATFDAPEREIHLRVAGYGGKIYLDLCDDKWRVVEIGADGWRVMDTPAPVRFRRASGMLPLPIPAKDGSIESLKGFINISTDSDFMLVTSWLFAALRPYGPYPVLVLAGEQGSAKSTLAATLKELVDPNSVMLKALPREDRDLFISANNGHVLSFDNVSGLPTWISDTLCRLSTGGGFSTRALYTNQDEQIFDAQRPIILNGIEDVVTRPDLADRSLFLHLEAIPEADRRSEHELQAALDSEKPRLIGALLDVMAHGLKCLPDTHLAGMPRMADFAVWATACETAIWPTGAFMAAYGENIAGAVMSVIDADLVATAVKTFMATRLEWTGAAAELLYELERIIGDKAARNKQWPESPRALSGRLRRAATFLRKAGIHVEFDRKPGGNRERLISISKVPLGDGLEVGKFASQPSLSSQTAENSHISRDANRDAKATVPPTVPENSFISNGWDGRDGRDAKFLTSFNGNGDEHLRLPPGDANACDANFPNSNGHEKMEDSFESLKDPSLALQPDKSRLERDDAKVPTSNGRAGFDERVSHYKRLGLPHAEAVAMAARRLEAGN